MKLGMRNRASRWEGLSIQYSLFTLHGEGRYVCFIGILILPDFISTKLGILFDSLCSLTDDNVAGSDETCPLPTNGKTNCISFVNMVG